MENLKITIVPSFLKGMLFALFLVLLGVSACEEFYIGKSREEINEDMSRVLFEVDSLMMELSKYDSLYYINAQRINNGHQ
jgi:hypothetical protein